MDHSEGGSSPVPYGFLPFQRKDRTIKPWDQTPNLRRGPALQCVEANAIDIYDALLAHVDCDTPRIYPSATYVSAEVTGAIQSAEGLAIETSDGGRRHARRLVIAIGVTDELPDILGLKERWGTTVLHYPYCHGYEVRDRPLGVIAGGAMSVHQALLVADWGPTTLFVQDAEAPGPDELARLHARKVSVESTPVVALLGSRGPLEAVRLANGRIVSLAAAFVTPRTRPTGHLAERLGCEMVDGPTGPFVKVDPWGRTSIPGIFAAGDIAAPMHNATLATAGGVVAGIAAHQSLALA